MELYLLRHGRSLANAANLVTGGKADTLCPEGRGQARAASGLLRRYGLDSDSTICFVSDWERAKETATLAAPNRAFNVDSRLGETDAGAAAGMTLAAFTETHPCFWSEFDPDRSYPEGESHRQLYERVLSWQKEIEETVPPDAKILAVTHAGPICCLLHAACKVSMHHFPMFLAANASLTKLERVGANSWRVAFFGSASVCRDTSPGIVFAQGAGPKSPTTLRKNSLSSPDGKLRHYPFFSLAPEMSI